MSNAGRVHIGSVATHGGVVAFVRTAGERLPGPEGTNDLGAAGQQGNDAHSTSLGAFSAWEPVVMAPDYTGGMSRASHDAGAVEPPSSRSA